MEEDKTPTPDLEAFKAFIYEFREETDRAAVILGQARLDFLLQQMITKFLLPNTGSKDELFDQEGPLSTFSAKINLAYRLNLIDAKLTRALHIIRKIRNAFAHETTGCKLDSGTHKDRVKELILPLNKTQSFWTMQKVFGKIGPSADFRTALALIAARLERGLLSVDQMKPLPQPMLLVPKEREQNKQLSDKDDDG